MARKERGEGIASGGGRWDVGGIARGPKYAEGFISPTDYTMPGFDKYFSETFLNPESTPGFTPESDFNQAGPAGGWSGGKGRKKR